MNPLPNDLPTWMRPRRRRIDWGVLFVLLVGLLLNWPLAFWAGLPAHTEAALFVTRAIEIADSLRSGTLYTRWAADFHFGYGSPLFNYLAPLPHYLSGLHQLITDANPIDSVKLLLAVSILVAGVGMYYFAGRRFGQRAGLIAAVVYMTSTPIAYALPVQTGDLALLLNLALLPWALWALDRLIAHPIRREWLIALTFLTLWSLADTRLTLVELPLLAIVVGGIWPDRRARLAIWWLLAAAALITSFFWLPALVERKAVQWLPLAADPRSGAIPLSESLGTAPIPAPNIQNPASDRGLGVGFSLATAIGIVALIGAIRAQWHTSPKPLGRYRDVIGFGLLGIFALLATTPPIANWWMVPDGWQPLRPYDLLLGVALPGLTLIAAQAGQWWPDEWPKPFRWQAWRVISFGGLLALPLIGIVPTFESTPWSAAIGLDSPLSVKSETAINAINTLRSGLLLPVTAYDSTAPLSQIIFASAEHSPVVPAANILLIRRTPLLSQYSVNRLGTNAALTLDRLAFPGWAVVFNGQTAPDDVTDSGLVRFDALNVSDANRDAELVLVFSDTPIRYLAWLLTLLGVALVFGRLLIAPSPPSISDLLTTSDESWSRLDLLALALVLVGFIVAGVALRLSPNTNPTLLSSSNAQFNTAATGIPTTTYPAQVVGTEHEPVTYQPGDNVQFTVLWRVARPINADWELIARLIPAEPRPLVLNVAEPQVTQWQPGNIPTSQWLPGLLIRDPVTIPLPANLSPGHYHIQVALAYCDHPQRLPCDSPTPIAPNLDHQAVTWLLLADSIQVAPIP